MPRTRTNPVHNFFVYNKETDVSSCAIDGCRTTIKGKHSSNLGRHVYSLHKNEYATLKKAEPSFVKRPADVSILSIATKKANLPGVVVQTNLNELKAACVELVAANERPVSILDDSGFRKILDPILNAFGSNATINSSNICDIMKCEALDIKQIVCHEVCDILVGLKIDTIVKSSFYFLAIHIQYVKDGKIMFRTLGVKQLYKHYTMENVMVLLLEVLSDYNLLIRNIYTLTIDNSANMIKTHDYWLNDEQEKEKENMCNDTPVIEDHYLHIDNICLENSDDSSRINGIPCFAHIFQWAIEDAMKASELLNDISQIRDTVKKLHDPATIVRLKDTDKKIPVLDSPTCWLSTLDMISDLVNVKDFCISTAGGDSVFSNSELMWDDYQKIVMALTPAKKTTQLYQEEQLVPGDFYGAWLRCKISTEKVGTLFARNIVEALTKRESELFDTDAFIGSIFLDPRYQCTLTKDAILRARLFLQNLWKRITQLVPQISSPQMINDMDADNSCEIIFQVEGEDELDMWLKKKEEENAVRNGHEFAKDIACILEEFISTPRLHKNEHLLDFWESQKLTKPELYALSLVVHSVPVTRVSVGSILTDVKFILSCQKCQMSSQHIDDMLVVRANYRFRENSIDK